MTLDVSYARVVVCVPTCRRADQLASLLLTLRDHRVGEPFAIVVGNNDATDAPTLAVLNDPACAPSFTVDVAEPGVAAVRNAMIAAVLARSPTVEWIACIDDDQRPDDGWLGELLAAGRRHAADVVGGPVRQSAACTTFWAAAATDMSHLPTTEGPVTMLNAAGNLMLAARFVRTLGRPPFSPRFGRSGGEDYEFFRHAKHVGAHAVWAPRAIVREVLPAIRLSLTGLVWRAYSTAASQSRADLIYDPVVVVVGKTLLDVAKAPVKFLRSLARDHELRKATGLLVRALAGCAGRLAGLLGLNAERYGHRSGGHTGRR